jgi:mono/diheme cytochrome c family protein
MRLLAAIFSLALLAYLPGCDVGRSAEESPEAKAPPPESAKAAAPAGAAAWKMPLPDLGYNEREGRALYSHYCSTCHGNEGHGDGLNAFNLDPKPRDLGDPAFQAKRSDEDLSAVIRSGGGVAGLSTGMPPWGRTLGDRKIRNIVSYLRTLKPEAP